MRRLLVAAALAATSAANLVLLHAFLDATAHNRKLAGELASHRCPAVPLVHDSKPPASWNRTLVEPKPVRDPALIVGSEGGRA